MKTLSIFISLLCLSFGLQAEESLIRVQSNHSVEETANRLESLINKKGLTLFARVNHQKNAKGVDLELRPTELIIFGNPKVGTPLMQCAQDVAIDLPQKMLIKQDEDNQVWVVYNNPSYLKQRHNIQGCDKIINKISGVLNKISSKIAE